ncbi:DUF4214 domain-containing protein [Aquihabitans sp. McL0605]|uniref:DUF4214 domain-containing protein n=1 Tax=Aquihabitans sp. McL0605 TaxID=3415671 RepID=UPI003CF7BE2D
MSCSCHPDDEHQKRHLSRRLVLAGGLAVGLTPLLPRVAGATDPDPGLEGTDGATGAATRDYGFLPPRPASEKYVRPIMFPVLPDATLGKATWSDTYLAPRSGGRLHEGQDLMGKKMLKLLAVTDGTIVELRHDTAGNSLYLKGDDGWYYCYLHINNDDPGTDNGANQFKYAFTTGMAIGKRVLKGEHIAYLGDSGNAEATGSHCHFEIRMPNAKWYNAAAVNAKYSLEAALPAKVRAKVADAAFAPLANASAFARQQSLDFLGLEPSAAWLQQAVGDLEGAVVGLDAFIEGMLAENGSTNITAPIIRLYLGYFLRIPDYGGLAYWIGKIRTGTKLDAAATQFANSREFIKSYGPLTNTAFVTKIYELLFTREPDAAGLAYWVQRLDNGASRGWVMRQMCESTEYKRKTDSQVRVIQVYTAMLNRAPDSSGYDYWAHKDAGIDTGLQQLIKSLRTGTTYASRF